MNVFLDLEMMPLDARGVWIDEYATRERESVIGPNQLPGNGNGYHRPGPMGTPQPLHAGKTAVSPRSCWAALFLFGFLIVAGFVGVHYGRR